MQIKGIYTENLIDLADKLREIHQEAIFQILANPGLLCLFVHCKAFYNNDLQTGHSIETFPHL